jgi:hypothetical protein
MSRAYRVSVKETATRELKGEDAVSTRLELLDILPPEDTAALLRAELKSRGFDEQKDGTLARQDGTRTMTVDPCTGEITVSAKAEATVDLESHQSGFAIDDVGPDQELIESRLRREALQALDDQAKREAAKLQAKASADLERHLDELQPEIGKIVNKVTREALKAKASRLGSVKEIDEDERTGEMTIKVEV